MYASQIPNSAPRRQSLSDRYPVAAFLVFWTCYKYSAELCVMRLLWKICLLHLSVHFARALVRIVRLLSSALNQ